MEGHLGRFTSDLAHQPRNKKPREPCQHPANQISRLGIVHMEMLCASNLVQYMKIIGYNAVIAQCFAQNNKLFYPVVDPPQQDGLIEQRHSGPAHLLYGPPQFRINFIAMIDMQHHGDRQPRTT